MTDLIHQIEQQMAAKPADIALFSDNKPFTNHQLWQQVLMFADLFSAHDIQRLGIYLENGIDWIAADLACLWLGITSVPIPHFFSEQQQAHIIDDASLDALLCSSDTNDASWLSSFTCKIINIVPSLHLMISLQKEANAKHQLPEATVKISYTSGSSGAPKGVCLSSCLLHDTTNALFNEVTKPELERHLSVLPYATLLENIAGVYLPLLSGVTIYALPMKKVGILASLNVDAKAFINTFATCSPTSMILTPQLLQLVCQLTSQQLIDPKCLQFVAVGGAHSPRLLMMQAADLGLPVFQGYGLTEAGSVVSLSAFDKHKIGKVGKPLPHLNVTISDDNEILLSGNQFGQYLGASIAFPEQINTKDVGFMDEDGYLSIDGRSKNMFILSTGRNINPEWLESELLQQQEIAQCLVYGEAQSVVSALIVPSSEHITHSEIEQSIMLTNLRLPEYAQIKSWQLVEPFSFNNKMLTANGKVVRDVVLATCVAAENQFSHATF